MRAEDAIGLAGVWLDVDVIGGPGGKKNAAPDLDAAIALGGGNPAADRDRQQRVRGASLVAVR